MAGLDLRPPLIGREHELAILRRHLRDAASGKGSVAFISGEAGIGKTRLVEELKRIASSERFTVLSSSSFFESLTPYMPFLEALRSGGLEGLFAEDTPRVEGVYLVTDTGLLVQEALREQSRLDPNIFASMLATVRDFVRDSLSMLTGEGGRGALNRLDFGRHSILIEAGENVNLVAVLTGRENEFLLADMKETLEAVARDFGSILHPWQGDQAEVAGIEKPLIRLIRKYDGAYYGSENPQARRNLLFENVSLGLQRHAQTSPTLLCIEDLQWADPSTLALVQYVARNTRDCGFVVLGTYRPEDLLMARGSPHHLTESLQMMGREDLFEKVELNRLTRDATEGILRSLLVEADLDPAFINRLHAETEGNPLFLIELLNLMVADGTLAQEDGRWRLIRGLGETSVPPKIREVIVRRLSRLEPMDKEVLSLASVIGEQFDSRILGASARLDRVSLLKGLSALEQGHRLLDRHDGRYRFSHVMIKDVLYGELPVELRMEYHGAVGDAIANLQKDPSDDVIGDLAFHYSRCGDSRKALPFLLRAAERAKREYANAEAIRFYTEALELSEDSEERRELFEGIGSVYQLTGAYRECLECYKKALDLAEEPSRRAEILASVGRVYELKGDYEESLRHSRESLTLVTGKASKVEALATINMGIVHWRRGEYDAALGNYRKGLEIAEVIGEQFLVAKSLNNIGLVHMIRGDYEDALNNYRKSLEIAEKIGDRNLVARLLGNIGIVHSRRGDYDAALKTYREGLEIAEKTGDRNLVAGSLNSVAIVHMNRGDLDAALESLESGLEIAEKIGDRNRVASILNNIGEVHMNRGAHDTALTLLRESLTMTAQLPAPGLFAEAECIVAETELLKGDLTRALDACGAALSVSTESNLKEFIARSRRIRGMIYRERQMWSESMADFEASIEVSARTGELHQQGKSHFEFALMWDAYGNADKAKEHLVIAAGLFEKLKLERDQKLVMSRIEAFRNG